MGGADGSFPGIHPGTTGTGLGLPDSIGPSAVGDGEPAVVVGMLVLFPDASGDGVPEVVGRLVLFPDASGDGEPADVGMVVSFPDVPGAIVGCMSGTCVTFSEQTISVKGVGGAATNPDTRNRAISWAGEKSESNSPLGLPLTTDVILGSPSSPSSRPSIHRSPSSARLIACSMS